MAEQIISASGTQYGLIINSDGSIPVTPSETNPIDVTKNNPYMVLEYISSGAGTGIDTGSAIGSITQFIGTGSYVKSLTYNNNNLVNIGSWI